MPMLRNVAAFAVMVASPAFAESGPSFDCGKAGSSAETLICNDPELARLDRLVSDRYAAALEVVRELASGASETEEELRALQRGWIKGRDECWKAADPSECIRAAYLRREGELVALWLLKEPAGVAFWTCDGNPANEVVTFFFDTETPSVRFERGDTIDTGSLVATASGSEYEGSFGRSIWIKGDQATYREADPAAQTYSCMLANQQ